MGLDGGILITVKIPMILYNNIAIVLIAILAKLVAVNMTIAGIVTE